MQAPGDKNSNIIISFLDWNSYCGKDIMLYEK